MSNMRREVTNYLDEQLKALIDQHKRKVYGKSTKKYLKVFNIQI